jgi:fatty aldehyde-generating acyl-ACP reductase
MESKFAFIVHVRNSYRIDFKGISRPLGLLPEAFYRFALRHRPLAPFIWSEVTVTPGATSPEGYIIMVPYSGRQLLEQKRLMLPRIKQAINLAVQKGADVVGLGAFISTVTMGGELVADDTRISVTNGNAYTAVITWKRVDALIAQCSVKKPVVALVGATGSVGSLVAKLLAKKDDVSEYILIARNERKINKLAKELAAVNGRATITVSVNMDDVKRADIVVLLTSASHALLQPVHLKQGAVVLDDTLPRNTEPEILKQRPDLRIIDGGLVSLPHLKFTNTIGLPRGVSFACLAETVLLAKNGFKENFSIGNPTLEQAEFINEMANQASDLGFKLAPDFCFGNQISPQF